IAYCYFLIFAGVISNAQTNLVPNPSFETYTTCPNYYGNLSTTGNWYPATLGSPDYFDTCDVFYVDVPGNFMGHQKAFDGGGGYAGFYSYYLAFLYREYIQT